MYIMVVDIDLLKYPFSAHSQPIKFFWKESKHGPSQHNYLLILTWP